MAMQMDAEILVPAQYVEPQRQDFRNAVYGPRGYKVCNKRKLEEVEAQAQEDEAAVSMREAQETELPPKKRTKLNTVGIGKASGRPWKSAGERAGALKNPLLSTPWEKKMKLKAERDNFKAAKQDALAALKEKAAKKRKQREDARARKEENRKKSSVTQTITSNATLRKMMKSKKQRKLLQKADTLKQ